MPLYISYGSVSGEGIKGRPGMWELPGGALGRMYHARNIRKICRDEGLWKVPLKKEMQGDWEEMMHVTWEPFEKYGGYDDPHRPLMYCPGISGLRVNLNAFEPGEHTERVRNAIQNYVKVCWQERRLRHS